SVIREAPQARSWPTSLTACHRLRSPNLFTGHRDPGGGSIQTGINSASTKCDARRGGATAQGAGRAVKIVGAVGSRAERAVKIIGAAGSGTRGDSRVAFGRGCSPQIHWKPRTTEA